MKNIYLAATVIVVGLILGGAMFLRFEGSSGKGQIIQGEVILHSNGGAGKMAADPYFVVSLENGTQVNVRDWGVYLQSYKGPVKIRVSSGKTTGQTIYEFTK
jgi:hypothetical protein